MATNDVSVLRIVGRYQNQNIVNTLHYQHATQADDENNVLESLVNGWDNDNVTEWLDRHLDSYELIGYKAFRTTGVAKKPYFRSIGTSGNVIGTEMLSSVGRTVTLYTESDNHRRRGRVMLSGGDGNMFSALDGSVLATEIIEMQALGVRLMTPIFDASNEFLLCLPPTDVLPFELITGVAARSTPASIRSRRIKRFYIG